MVKSAGLTLDPVTGLVSATAFIESPNCDERPAGVSVDMIVVHCISLPPGEYGGGFIERFFCNELEPGAHPYFREICSLEVSAHFLIYRTGRLVQFVPTHRRAWHAGPSRFGDRERINDYSIGIELEGTDESPFTGAQYESLVDLSAALVSAYPRIEVAKVVGHSDIAPGRKTDPGACFDWARFRRALQQRVR